MGYLVSEFSHSKLIYTGEIGMRGGGHLCNANRHDVTHVM